MNGGQQIWGTVSRKRLMENITLLRMLNETPESRKENALPSESVQTKSLTMEREAEIAGNLAFLAASTEDPLRVKAVCIEEDDDSEGMTIRIACNTGKLSEDKVQFERIARILEKATLRGSSRLTDVETLLRQVVILDYGRILTRLRSRHAIRSWKHSNKRNHIARLSASLQKNARITWSGITEEELGDIRGMVEDIQTLIRGLDAIQNPSSGSLDVQEIIMAILKQIHQLNSASPLKDAIGNSTLDEGIKRSMPEAIGKIGRYYSACYDLVSAARCKSIRLFKRISVQTIQPPQETPVVSASNTPILAALQGALAQQGLQEQLQGERLKQSLESHLRQPFLLAQTTFQNRLSGSIRRWKVHAEIQLLLFYELHPEINHPRVICSTKSACYLCDLFVKLHGEYHIPSTHGRLYDRWILPDQVAGLSLARRHALGIVVGRFNALLEEKISSTLRIGRVPCTHPNESIFVMPGHWSPSTLSEAPSFLPPASMPLIEFNTVATKRSDENPIVPSPPRSPQPETSSTTTLRGLSQAEASNNATATATATTTAAAAAVADLVESPTLDLASRIDRNVQESPQPNTVSNSAPQVVPMLPSPPATPPQKFYERLVQGEYIWKELSHPNRVLRVSTDCLHVSLSREHDLGEGSEERSDPSNTCWVRIKWLTYDEQLQVGSEEMNIVNMNRIPNGSETTWEHGTAKSSTKLLVRRRQDMISVKYSLHGPDGLRRLNS